MAKFIYDTDEINSVKPNCMVTNLILSQIWQKDAGETRRLIKLLKLKPTKEDGYRNKKTAYYKYLTIAQWKKLFTSKGWSEQKIDEFVTSMQRDDFSVVKRKKRKYKKNKLPKSNPKPAPVLADNVSVGSGVTFAISEAKKLGCDPEKYAQSVERAIASGYWQATA